MEKCWLPEPHDLRKKRIWVAGHNGMVGQALLRRLAHEGCDILTVSRDDLDCCHQGAVQDWMQQNRPDMIILAAAKVGGIGANNDHPAEFFYDNMMISTNVIHSAYEAGVDRLLFLGSSCIYPRECGQPITEDMLLTGALEPTNEAYALAKIGGLKMAQYYRRQYGCDFISAMPCNLYGVGDRYDVHGSHVIPALIMKAHAAKDSNAPLHVWGSGSARREFLYVDDLADSLVMLLKSYNGAEHINIGSGEEVQIKDVVYMVRDVVGHTGDVIFDVSKPDGTPRKVMDKSKVAEAGWMPKMSLRDGIQKAYMDYIARLS